MLDLDELQYTSAICADLSEVFLVDRVTKAVTVIRHNAVLSELDGMFDEDHIYYDDLVDVYIRDNVFEGDKDRLKDMMDLDSICRCLDRGESTTLYYRAGHNGDMRYLRLKCTRVGEADSYRKIIYVFIPEDYVHIHEQVRHIAETDEVTGIYTREAFSHYARKMIADGPDENYYLIVADVENFKRINRIYGRNFGDDVLRYLSKCYSSFEPGVLCARIGGDQFAMLAHSAPEEETDRFYSTVERIRADAPVSYITIRYGADRIVDKSDSIEDMIDKCMLAMRSHKNFHDDPIAFYDSNVIQNQLKAQMYNSEFERGIAENQFVIWCQPKYSTAAKTMTSAEALVRWQRDGEIIQPTEFIPVFEANGLIMKLDEYVFEAVCRYQRGVIDAGNEPLPISVNMSRTGLYRGGVVKIYKEIIESYNIPKRLVPIELTESATVENDQIERFIDDLKSAGFAIHMDDFGSGYSSLSNLSSLHFDAIKIDKRLIGGIGTPRGEEVIRHIIGIAHLFSMEVIAEGVEHRSQYKYLKNLECDTVQGYYFSRPVPVEEFSEMCRNQAAEGYTAVSRDDEDKYDEANIKENGKTEKHKAEKRKAGNHKSDEHKKAKRITPANIAAVMRTILYKGEQNEVYRANAFSLGLMWASLLVLVFCWLLDILNIFIVDIHIMNTCVIGSLIICVLICLYAKIVGIDRPNSRYFILTAMIILFSYIFMELSYHTTLTMAFPLLCAMIYFDRRLTIYTYIMTCLCYGAAVITGYKIGLCDSNMLLLTYTTSAFHSAALTSGNFTINTDIDKMLMFFVAPRWMLLFAMMPLLSHLAGDIQLRTKREARIRHLAEIDGLTGAYNRYKYVQSVNSYYPGINQVAVLYFDINNLKLINDTKGHECGDRLICGLTEELTKRESDNCKTYRIGGDEFVMILERNAAYRVNEIKEEISHIIGSKTVDENMKLSVAIGSASGVGKDIENIVNEADEQMYQAKLRMKV